MKIYTVTFITPYGNLKFDVNACTRDEAYNMAAETLGQLDDGDCDYKIK